MKKFVIFFVKTSIVALIFGALVYRALNGTAFSELKIADLNLAALALGVALNLLATVVTILRWRALVQALDAPLSIVDSLKYGFIGFMFNLSPIGIVGGDAIKVALLSKKNGVSVAKSAASVVIDRAIGLFAMFVLGLVFVFVTGFYHNNAPAAKIAARGIVVLTALAVAFFAFVAIPTSERRRREKLAQKIPFVGKFLAKITFAVLAYSQRKKTLAYSFVATLGVHLGFSASLYFIARGLFGDVPNMVDHCVLYCLGNVGSVIPLSAGPLEYFLDELYPLFAIPGRAPFDLGYGMTIGVAYRLASAAAAFVGVAFYAFAKSDVDAARDVMEN